MYEKEAEISAVSVGRARADPYRARLINGIIKKCETHTRSRAKRRRTNREQVSAAAAAAGGTRRSPSHLACVALASLAFFFFTSRRVSFRKVAGVLGD